MNRTARYFAQNDNTDEFDELSQLEYQGVLYGNDDYINNTVVVYEGDGQIATMYDVNLKNVYGCVIAELCKLFKRLGMQTDF